MAKEDYQQADLFGAFRPRQKPADHERDASSGTDDKYLTVTELNDYVHHKFNHDERLHYVYLQGEISNWRYRPGGHQYFNLKDDRSDISAVMFRGSFQHVKFMPKEGMKVLVKGRVQTYVRYGRYQIVIYNMEPTGKGALFEALQQLKSKLAKEGLFNRSHKKPIPKIPRQIAVVTSQNGAVIRDIIRTARLRWPYTRIVLYPASVNGASSSHSIATQLQRADQGGYDTIIVGRGGGSVEDLWCFESEQVVRAIYDCQTPVISSVGHETDTTLADYAADVRAATPTAAAEIATPDHGTVVKTLNNLRYTIYQTEANRIKSFVQRFAKVKSSFVYRDPSRLFQAKEQTVDIMGQKLQNAMQRRVANAKSQLDNRQQQVAVLHQRLENGEKNVIRQKTNAFEQAKLRLHGNSPMNAVEHGYSMVTRNGTVVSDANTVEPGQKIRIRFKNGTITATVDKRLK